MVVKLNSKFYALSFACLSFSLFFNTLTAHGYNESGAYAGLEFYGSPQMSREEVEKFLGLHSGSSYKSAVSGVARLKRELKARRMDANVQIVTGDGSDIYVSVDILGDENEMPCRILQEPHQVNFRSEEPVMLLQKLHERMDSLEAEGRPVSEEFRDGVKYYSDEPCNQIVRELIRHCEPMRDELIYLIDHDPNNVRRLCAAELLSWAGNVPDTAARLLPAVDDVDLKVRTTVTRYLFKSLPLLPDDFPFADMVDVYSRDLARPSHEDRSKSLYMLLAILKRRPELVRQVRSLDEKRIQQLKARSLVPSIKLACAQFDKVFTRANVGLTDVIPNLDFLQP